MTQSNDTGNVAAADIDRRSFLRGLGVSAAAAPAAALGLAAQPAAAADAKGDAASGYQETEHVRRAYDAARF